MQKIIVLEGAFPRILPTGHVLLWAMGLLKIDGCPSSMAFCDLLHKVPLFNTYIYGGNFFSYMDSVPAYEHPACHGYNHEFRVFLRLLHILSIVHFRTFICKHFQRQKFHKVLNVYTLSILERFTSQAFARWRTQWINHRKCAWMALLFIAKMVVFYLLLSREEWQVWQR